MAKMERQARGRISPFERGGDDEFVIPPDMMPDGLESGNDMEFVIRGTLNVDKETGQGVVYVNRLYARKPHSRQDTMQDETEVAVNSKDTIKERKVRAYRGDSMQDAVEQVSREMMRE